MTARDWYTICVIALAPLAVVAAWDGHWWSAAADAGIMAVLLAARKHAP